MNSQEYCSLQKMTMPCLHRNRTFPDFKHMQTAAASTLLLEYAIGRKATLTFPLAALKQILWWTLADEDYRQIYA